MVPTGPTEGWRSQMSLPRTNYLRNATRIGYVLVSEPHNIQSVFSQELAYNSSLGNSTLFVDYSAVPSGALYFEANITSLSPYTAAGTLNFTFSSSISGEYVTGGTTVGGDTWLDRGKTTAFDNPYFTDKFSASGLYSGKDNGTWTISGVIDHSIFEVFVNGGEQSGTMTYYATRPLDIMRIGANGIASNATVSVSVWALEDTWAAQADANGTVLGNVTRSTSGSASNGTYRF
jgi:beta-fructofuranosidase